MCDAIPAPSKGFLFSFISPLVFPSPPSLFLSAENGVRLDHMLIHRLVLVKLRSILLVIKCTATNLHRLGRHSRRSRFYSVSFKIRLHKRDLFEQLNIVVVKRMDIIRHFLNKLHTFTVVLFQSNTRARKRSPCQTIMSNMDGPLQMMFSKTAV